MAKSIQTILFIFLAGISFAQTPFPNTEIFLTEMMVTAKGHSFTTPINITNRDGYDNQPCFSPDGKAIFFSSIREDGQADIYRYEILTKKESRITNTKESEYSPTIMPGKKFLSCVRVEKDSTQRIWKFPIEGGDPELLFNAIDSVGYHCWLGKDTVALFKISEPPILELASASNNPFIVSKNIGRCLRMIPGEHALSFVVKEDSLNWILKKYSLNDLKISNITNTLSNSEDYAWMPDGSIIMGHEGKLFQFTDSTKGWKQIADFSAAIEKIGRVCLSPDGKKIAMVAIMKDSTQKK